MTSWTKPPPKCFNQCGGTCSGLSAYCSACDDYNRENYGTSNGYHCTCGQTFHSDYALVKHQGGWFTADKEDRRPVCPLAVLAPGEAQPAPAARIGSPGYPHQGSTDNAPTGPLTATRDSNGWAA